MDGRKTQNGLDTNDARAVQCSPRGVAACRAFRAKHTEGDGPGAHGWMVTQGQIQQWQQAWGQGKGRQIRHGKARADQQVQHKQAGIRSWPASGLVREVLWRECGDAGCSENGLGPTLLSPLNLSP